MMLMTEAPTSSLLGGCWILFLWPLDFGNVGGAGNMGKPKTSGGEKEKKKKKLVPDCFRF